MLWIALATAAPCDPAALRPALARAENAYLLARSAELRESAEEARREARCELSPADAARVLRLSALEHGLANDWDAAVEDLRASVAAHPLLPLEPGLAADLRLSQAWARAQEARIAWTLQSEGRFNGLEMAIRPDTVVWTGAPPEASSARRSARWAAVGGGVLAGGLYAGALVSRARYEDLRGGPEAVVLPAYRTTNALSVGAVVSGLAAGGLLGVSFAL